MTILNNILAVSWHEFRVMCTRYSILLVLSGGIFVYGLLYNYMYAPNVVRDAPVAVVDMSRTPLSRSYIRLLDATPQARVLTNNADLPAAKELMKYDEVVGIVYIPADFDARVGRGEEVRLSLRLLHRLPPRHRYRPSFRHRLPSARKLRHRPPG